MCARRVLAVLGWLWVLGSTHPHACAQFTDGMNVAFGKNRVQQHKMVFAALGDRMGGELHALQLHTGVPN